MSNITSIQRSFDLAFANINFVVKEVLYTGYKRGGLLLKEITKDLVGEDRHTELSYFILAVLDIMEDNNEIIKYKETDTKLCRWQLTSKLYFKMKEDGRKAPWCGNP